MICVGIYAILVNNMIIADNLHSAIFSLAAYTVILCFSLFKSGALAKSIFSAHSRRVKGRVEIFRAKRRKYYPTLTRENPIE